MNAFMPEVSFVDPHIGNFPKPVQNTDNGYLGQLNAKIAGYLDEYEDQILSLPHVDGTLWGWVKDKVLSMKQKKVNLTQKPSNEENLANFVHLTQKPSNEENLANFVQAFAKLGGKVNVKTGSSDGDAFLKNYLNKKAMGPPVPPKPPKDPKDIRAAIKMKYRANWLKNIIVDGEKVGIYMVEGKQRFGSPMEDNKVSADAFKEFTKKVLQTAEPKATVETITKSMENTFIIP